MILVDGFGILAFIGIMNFFNTTATSVISRKKELALLEVVGMTKKQVSKMLVTEGFLYLGGAFMIAVLLVVVGAKQILINTLGTAFFFRLHLTIVPCVLMIPILVGIAYVIPKYQFEKMSRERSLPFWERCWKCCFWRYCFLRLRRIGCFKIGIQERIVYNREKDKFRKQV